MELIPQKPIVSVAYREQTHKTIKYKQIENKLGWPTSKRCTNLHTPISTVFDCVR